MLTNNKGLVEFVKSKLGCGYVYGTFGQVLTPKLLDIKQTQYPNNINQFMDFICQNWLNKHVTDCVGLIKWYMWDSPNGVVYNPAQDVSANGMLRASKEKGPINTIPEIPGILVCKQGHIGVYIGNGEVIESHGTKYGVIKTPLDQTGWTHWCKCPFLVYEIEKKNWKQILDGANLQNADDWEKYIMELIVRADKGEVEKIFSYLPLLIEKVYESN